MSTAFYSIIQFCPNAARQEVVNVGVVLFDTKTGYVDVKLTASVDRIRQFFGNGVLDAKQLKVLGESVRLLLEREKQLLSSPDSFRTLTERQANELRFTTPRRIALGHKANLLEAVYRRFVEDHRQQSKAGGVKEKVRHELRKPEVARRVRQSVEVAVRRSPQPVRAPFAYQNGVFNLIQPTTFNADDAAGLWKLTGGLQLEGKLLHETDHPEYGPLGLIVVGEVKGAKRREAERFVTEELGQQNVAYYPVERLQELVEEIRRNAKVISPASTAGLPEEASQSS